MFSVQMGDLNKWEKGAATVSGVLKAVGNERRLLVLCQLAENGEMSVGRLVDVIGLSQSALSQHLARLRAEEVVAARRDGQTIYYRLADARIEALMSELYELYCKDLTFIPTE